MVQYTKHRFLCNSCGEGALNGGSVRKCCFNAHDQPRRRVIDARTLAVDGLLRCFDAFGETRKSVDSNDAFQGRRPISSRSLADITRLMCSMPAHGIRGSAYGARVRCDQTPRRVCRVQDVADEHRRPIFVPRVIWLGTFGPFLGPLDANA
jgi:hypothetical protein